MLALCLLSLLASTAPTVPFGQGAQAQPASARVPAEQRVRGSVEQVRPLPAPQDGMLEVFVRTGDNSLVQAIVPAAWGAAVVEGRHIDFAARSDGTYTYRDMEGNSRTVPRVKAIEAPTAADTGVDDLTLMLGLLVLLMAGFGVLALIVARTRSGRRSISDLIDEPFDEPVPEVAGDALPEDPAEAMGEMMRRVRDDES